MLEEKQAQVLAWLETGGIIRISRMWAIVSIVCFILTAIFDGRSIYMALQKNCNIVLDGKPIKLDLHWFILYCSFMFMLSFLLSRTKFHRATLEATLNSTQHDVNFKCMAIYIPILLFCFLTLVLPLLSFVIYWKTAFSASCARTLNFAP
jgi:hypothetical protein